ncbi:MAG: polyribonucleotide nucleotidyltransferase [Minisyncoccales bacterium]
MEKEFFLKKEIFGKEITFHFNQWASQANFSLSVTLGKSTIFTTGVMGKSEQKEIDYLPLKVEYEEKYYAGGKIKGSRFIRREARPSDEAILAARMIDRAIRPLFPKELKREVQIINTVLSWDEKNDPDVLGLLATSFGLFVSDIPWQGPLSVVRVGKIKDQFLINPTYQEREISEMDIVFSAVLKNNQLLINMIEGRFRETKEKEILEAFAFAKPYLEDLINFQIKEGEKISQKKVLIEKEVLEIDSKMRSFLKEKLESAFFKERKEEKTEKIEEVKKEFFSTFKIEPEKKSIFERFFQEELKNLLEEKILNNDRRPDGRKPDEIRKISSQVSLLPRTHGSALFSRGQTKVLSIVTLGAPNDVQLLEGMEISGKKRFLHHYNFPPYCTGETQPLRAPSRREIGHGMLAEKAILPLVPDFESFPYTIRVVSEVLSSNGSTSMASVCSSSLALWDAGVPLERMVAGIALGLVQKGERYKILVDIQGPEDHFGSMDFKIAGTKKGFTALQMDVKIEGISEKIFHELLLKSKTVLNQILQAMEKTLSERKNLSPFAPRIFIIKIEPEKIRDVIGPGGKMINEIIEECGVSIDIEPSGKVFVTSENEKAGQKAINWIKNITRKIEKGEIFYGKIKKLFPFGIMVEILPGQEGLVHISNLKKTGVENIFKNFKVGQIVPVKVLEIDQLGRINLTIKK